MNMLFIGGGSLRILPILRGVFEQAPKVFREGEIRLVDLQLERATAFFSGVSEETSALFFFFQN